MQRRLPVALGADSDCLAIADGRKTNRQGIGFLRMRAYSMHLVDMILRRAVAHFAIDARFAKMSALD